MNERQDQILAEITALKMLLRDTDYNVTKYAEGLTACTTQKQIEAYRAAFMAEHGEIINKRVAWRERINELEEELDGLTPEQEPELDAPAEPAQEDEPAEPAQEDEPEQEAVTDGTEPEQA